MLRNLPRNSRIFLLAITLKVRTLRMRSLIYICAMIDGFIRLDRIIVFKYLILSS
jgi:hypothetical protein